LLCSLLTPTNHISSTYLKTQTNTLSTSTLSNNQKITPPPSTTIMTEKDCSHHIDDERHNLQRRLITALIAFVTLILFTILLIFLILRPTKPHFILQDATVYAFNTSTPLISSRPTYKSRSPLVILMIKLEFTMINSMSTPRIVANKLHYQHCCHKRTKVTKMCRYGHLLCMVIMYQLHLT
ncbi:hypothetical protein AABB24_018931, partial [Solanum stoloniferum]